jgi:hypothetical protein
MNENAQKWVEALRSGEFKQGEAYLHTRDNGEDYYCCLGVACVLAEREGIVERITDDGNPDRLGADPSRHNQWHDKEDTKAAVLPESVRIWLGLASVDGVFYGLPTEASSLTALNDTGCDFLGIADTIEGEPPGLFADA